MTSTFRKYATPMITTFFVVSLVSGLALFFHLGGRAWHGIHEWLSIVLIIPFALHLWKNWRPMVNYFKRMPMMLSLVVAVALSVPFFMVNTEGAAGGPPQFALVERLIDNNAATLSPVLGIPADVIVTRLDTAGFDMSSPELSLRDVAALSGKTAFQLSAALARP
ncbi:DUF4405 domain-containing protein [Oceaniglobus roseus]|uniref:DUF4405 domain-containing protein n=1 Tax=Oceaniglobus roseus TaxID=1737570 RepID=UPI000C7EE7F2|nr:DUF4405 domain-containing protein [Kandeliimicrobium roseum]